MTYSINEEKGYDGRAQIYPGNDFQEYPHNDELVEEITEQLISGQFVSKIRYKIDVIRKRYDACETSEDFEEFFADTFCEIMKDSFIIKYERPVPFNFFNEHSFAFSWGFYQTVFIQIFDLTQLQSVLMEIDKQIISAAFAEQQEKEKVNSK